MRRALIFALAALALLFRADSASKPRQHPIASGRAERTSLDFVPASVPLAVEVRDLDRRWMEIRSSPALAHFQDSILQCAGITSELLPLLTGNDGVFFLAPAEDPLFLVPVAILQPADIRKAQEILSRMQRLSYRTHAGRMWIGPAASDDALTRLASEGGTRLVELLPMDEIGERLPPGGLVRGLLNPGECARLLRRAGQDASAGALPWVAAVLAAELDAARYVAFRRDIQDGVILADGIISYDLSRLPEEVVRTLNPRAAPPALPFHATSESHPLVVAAFRPEAQAWDSWLRYLAAHNPRGPLRNLGFWLDEIQERYRWDPEQDLFASLGNHGWFLALERADAIDAAVVFELRRGSAVEGPLTDLLSWMGEQVRLGSFGTAALRFQREMCDGDAFLRTSVRTPVRSLPGPGFAVTGNHLVVANTPEAFEMARTWIERLERSAISGEAHGSVIIQGGELSRMLGSIPLDEEAGFSRCVAEAIASILAQSGTLRVEMTYEEDAIRLRGQMRID
jgi:hypothetical protein